MDEALLLSRQSPPTLRLYRWHPPGLSLGYFQPSAAFRDVPGDRVLVRRLTGGGAIYHEDEITFSLSISADLLPETIIESYHLVHGAVRAALDELGVPTNPSDSDACSATGGRCDTGRDWCFANPAAGDLLTLSGRKLLGSAQRRMRRPTARVLHHGSLVLRAPAATPFCGSVAESVDPGSIEDALHDAMVRRLALALDLDPQDGAPTPAELDHASELASHRYASAGFTLGR